MALNHSMDIMKAAVYGRHMKAAEEGNYESAKECGKYFSLVDDLDNAIKYYELYLRLIPFTDMFVKMEVKALKAKRLKRSFFG